MVVKRLINHSIPNNCFDRLIKQIQNDYSQSSIGLQGTSPQDINISAPLSLNIVERYWRYRSHYIIITFNYHI